METFIKIIGGSVLAIGGILLLAVFMAFPIKWAWNEVIPSLFGLRPINAIDGWCLMFLANTFFKATLTTKK